MDLFLAILFLKEKKNKMGKKSEAIEEKKQKRNKKGIKRKY